MPPFGALRVVGRDDTYQQAQTRDAARAMAQLPPPFSPPQGLAGFITDQYIMFRRHRDTMGRGWSDRLLRALRAFDGVYEPEITAELKRFGGSSVYSRMVAMKCRGTTSLLRDVYIGPDRPWGVEPAADPEVPDTIIQAIRTFLSGQIQQAIQQHDAAIKAQQAHAYGVMQAHAYGAMTGQSPQQVDASIPSGFSGPSQGAFAGVIPPEAAAGMPPQGAALGAGSGMPAPPPVPPLPDPGALMDQYRAMVEDARDQAKRKAADQAKIAEDKIQEHLSLGGFYTALAECLIDIPLFPYAVMKGPTVRIKTQVKWGKSTSPSGAPGADAGAQSGNPLGGNDNTQPSYLKLPLPR